MLPTGAARAHEGYYRQLSSVRDVRTGRSSYKYYFVAIDIMMMARACRVQHIFLASYQRKTAILTEKLLHGRDGERCIEGAQQLIWIALAAA